MEYEKDYSLLRPFDLEAAKNGDLVCWYFDGERLEYVGTATSDRYAGCFKWLDGDNAGTYETYESEDLRMAPLCWVEGKPVYKGDVLYYNHKTYGPGKLAGAVDRVEGTKVYFQKGSNEFDGGCDEIGILTWTPPKTKQRVKMCAWFDGDQLFLLREGAEPKWPSKRVPSEDREIEVEE